ncbi:MAG: Bacterial extracellular solute-binding protein family 5 Middle, partial [Pseudomonadota bacterium]
MRNNRKIKRIGLNLFVALLVVSAILLLRSFFMRDNESMTLRVALNTSVPLQDLDTKEITDSSDYSVLELMLSTLVEYNNQGEIVGGIAERFYWDENRLIFEFREAYFSSGKRITPEDAIASFKRLMILNTNSHGDLVNLLCIKNRPQRLGDDCEGMKAEGNRLILITDKPTQFLLPLLTSVEYGILPQESFSNPELRIRSFADTSGAYRLHKKEDKFILLANERHWHYRKTIPQIVEFFVFDFDSKSPQSAQNLFQGGKVDFIPTASEIRLSDIESIKKEAKKSFRVNTTNPMALAYAEFTGTGLALPVETRRKIIACIRREVGKNSFNDNNGRVATIQVLPPSSAGNLSIEQTLKIESELQKYESSCDLSGVRIAVPEFLVDFYESALNAKANKLTIVPFPDVARFGNRTDSEVPELTVAGVDVTAIEDINFISYSVKNGILVPPAGQTPAEWLKTYFDTPEKAARMAMLQKIQFYTIWENPKIIPISIRPFVSVIDSRWK